MGVGYLKKYIFQWKRDNSSSSPWAFKFSILLNVQNVLILGCLKEENLFYFIFYLNTVYINKRKLFTIGLCCHTNQLWDCFKNSPTSFKMAGDWLLGLLFLAVSIFSKYL